jgi:hypothetical protein
MENSHKTWLDRLPYDSPMPADASRRPWAVAARVAGYVLVLGAILTSIIQFGYSNARQHRLAASFDAQHGRLTEQELAARNLERPKGSMGAIPRWRKAIGEFWAGADIYKPHAGPDEDKAGETALHPNMPFVVILLTPFTWLPPVASAWALGFLKGAVILAALWALVRVTSPRGARPADWVVFLGALWALAALLGDIRHGNTNTFVLGAIALHLWLFRRGRDIWAGASLALAVCLKMTPALFGLYWLYQRNWRLLVGLVAAMALFVAVVPSAAVGPGRAGQLLGDWWNNLIVPGLVKGQWYPQHINQSLPGTVGRYVLSGPGGNILWGPDDRAYEEQLRQQPPGIWINVVDMPDASARWLVRALQAAIVLLCAWSMGFRRLARDDGRRAPHYGLVILAMLILNQRTWDHHAAILPVATLPIWHAIAFGRLGARPRRIAFALALAALPMLVVPNVAQTVARLAGQTARQAEMTGNMVEAYGPTLVYFLLMLAAGVVLCRSLRGSEQPCLPRRQAFS